MRLGEADYVHRLENCVCNEERARVAQILARALEDGMRTLKQDGIEKVLAGITDMAQVRAVCIK